MFWDVFDSCDISGILQYLPLGTIRPRMKDFSPLEGQLSMDGPIDSGPALSISHDHFKLISIITLAIFNILYHMVPS